MKGKITILIIFLSVKLFGCKCENLTIQQSFKYADFVFIGTIYETLQVPSGFKTINNFFSKVNIKKIYKLDYQGEFYRKNATLFSSQLRSCDLFYDNNTEYLIFGYIEPDTNFIYSEFCTYTKPLRKVSQEDLNILENLKKEHLEKDKDIVIKPAPIDEIDTYINQPNILIDKLRRKTDLIETNYQILKTENKNLKNILFGTIAIYMTLLTLVIWKIKKR